jgi:hypothetical protein
MVQSSSACLLGPEFDDFLFAPLGEEKNGMLLRVVSALARLDLDPWQETTSLARLPKETATERLAALIAVLPDRPAVLQDPVAMASSLIARLPRPSSLRAPSADRPSGNLNPVVTQSQVFLLIAFLLVMLLGNLGFAESQQSPAPVNDALAPTARGISPPSPSDNP